jgi:hypothetical protein
MGALMRLTDDQFEKITHCKRVDEGKLAHAKRDAGRVGWANRVAVCRMENSKMMAPAFAARSRDLSVTGMGLLSQVPIRKSAALAVKLPLGRDGAVIILACEVTRCERVAQQDLYLLGARFTAELPGSDFPGDKPNPAKSSKPAIKASFESVEQIQAVEAEPNIDRIRAAILDDKGKPSPGSSEVKP